MAKNTKLLLGVGAAALAVGGIYWFMKGRKDAASGPLIADGTLRTAAGHRYRFTYTHTKDTGEILRSSLAAMSLTDTSLSVEKPSDTKTVVEGTVQPGKEASFIVPSEVSGIRLISVQEVPASGVSGLLAGI